MPESEREKTGEEASAPREGAAVRGEVPSARHAFVRALLKDLDVLEKMLGEKDLESDTRCIGAEQELFLVDADGRPRMTAAEILGEMSDPRVTAELGLFNLELNLDPVPLGPGCLRRMELELEELLERLAQTASSRDTRILLTGILPTLDPSHLHERNMTPKERYAELDQALRELRGDCELSIKGIDELRLSHPNVMPEACNTSFQVHLEVGGEDFARYYNAAQLAAGPVLAAATNSPLLFGKRLWRETRIALFEQSIDDRPKTSDLRRRPSRVGFGSTWVRESVLEIFREDVGRHRVLLEAAPGEDPHARWEAGGPPKLEALCLFNSTVWRWNRPCYGVTDGRPHLRIENRLLPSGPTVVDEMANAAFWIGVVEGLVSEHGDVAGSTDFRCAKESFLRAARSGLGAHLHWLDSAASAPAQELLLEEVIPLARRGLASLGVGAAEAGRYLDVVEERVTARRTGASWLLDSLEAMGSRGSEGERRGALAAAAYAGQVSGEPVARWPVASLDVLVDSTELFGKVRQVMSTEPFTVQPEQWIDLVTCLMEWHHLRHIPVEDDDHRLVGLITYRSLLRYFGRREEGSESSGLPVRDLMIEDVVTVRPETRTLDAVRRMRELGIGCLPVVDGDRRLVGIVRERDLLPVAQAFLEGRAGTRTHPEPAH